MVDTNVKDKKRKDFDKAFHTTAKRSASYKSKGRVLDLIDGPIISEEDYNLIQNDHINIEFADIATSEEEIRNL